MSGTDDIGFPTSSSDLEAYHELEAYLESTEAASTSPASFAPQRSPLSAHYQAPKKVHNQSQHAQSRQATFRQS